MMKLMPKSVLNQLPELNSVYHAPKWLKNLSKIVSFIFHPVFLPMAGVLFLFSLGLGFQSVSPDLRNKLTQLVLAIVAISTILLPLVAIPMLYSFKIISSIEMKQSKERVFPFLLTAISIFWGYILLQNFPVPVPEIMLNYILASSIATLLLAVVSVFYKISAHLTGLGGFFALILFINTYYLPDTMLFFNLTLALLALIATARLLLHEHNGLQLISGFLVGFSIVGFLLYYG